jgi:histidinol-phosphate aminotransferase
MSKYWSDFVHKLVPYVPGEQPKIANLVKLNTNENPYPPSPKAVAAMQRVLAGNGDELRLYPDPNSDLLKEAIARFYQIEKANVFVGNGSDEVLAHVFFGLLKHDKPVLFPDITYSFYPVYCGLYKVPFKTIPLTEKFEIDLRQYEQANGGIIFPNPNAPTGVLVSLAVIERLLQENPDSVVVVDEAYIDFSGQESSSASAIPLVKKYPNLLVTQTVSKSRSLAGLRVGLAIGHPGLIEALERIKNSFNSYPLGRMAIVGAAVAFDDVDYFHASCQQVISNRETLVAELKVLGFDVLPSAANFIFVSHPHHDAAKLMQQLRERAVLVRYFKLPRIEQYLRITIGTPEQNAVLVKALKEIL